FGAGVGAGSKAQAAGDFVVADVNAVDDEQRLVVPVQGRDTPQAHGDAAARSAVALYDVDPGQLAIQGAVDGLLGSHVCQFLAGNRRNGIGQVGALDAGSQARDDDLFQVGNIFF